MDVSGGLAAPTAVLGALGGEVCQPKAGVQIYDEVTDSVIEAFIMMLMVGAVEEVVTIKEGVECRETCWGIPKGHGALTANGGTCPGAGSELVTCGASVLLGRASVWWSKSSHHQDAWVRWRPWESSSSARPRSW